MQQNHQLRLANVAQYIAKVLHHPEAAARNFESQAEDNGPYVGNWIEPRMFTLAMFKLIILNSIYS